MFWVEFDYFDLRVKVAVKSDVLEIGFFLAIIDLSNIFYTLSSTLYLRHTAAYAWSEFS